MKSCLNLLEESKRLPGAVIVSLVFIDIILILLFITILSISIEGIMIVLMIFWVFIVLVINIGDIRIYKKRKNDNLKIDKLIIEIQNDSIEGLKSLESFVRVRKRELDKHYRKGRIDIDLWQSIVSNFNTQRKAESVELLTYALDNLRDYNDHIKS